MRVLHRSTTECIATVLCVLRRSTSEGSALLHKTDWRGKTVLEIGCGEGDLAALIAAQGAERATAVDFARSGIDTANRRYNRPNLEYDAAISKMLRDVRCHRDGGHHRAHGRPLLCPEGNGRAPAQPTRPNHHEFPVLSQSRGYIWMALQLLFDVPMSLSDRHFLCPFDFEDFADKLGARIDYLSVDQDWGHGERLIEDFDKRLRNALRDRGLDGNVDRFMTWLGRTIDRNAYTEFSGANIVYEFFFAQ